jgi:hypothetical protein
VPFRPVICQAEQALPSFPREQQQHGALAASVQKLKVEDDRIYKFATGS